MYWYNLTLAKKNIRTVLQCRKTRRLFLFVNYRKTFDFREIVLNLIVLSSFCSPIVPDSNSLIWRAILIFYQDDWVTIIHFTRISHPMPTWTIVKKSLHSPRNWETNLMMNSLFNRKLNSLLNYAKTIKFLYSMCYTYSNY